MRNDDVEWARNMVDTSRRILRRMQGLSRAEFDGDEDVQLALIYLIQSIGEAASRTSRAFRDAHPAIPWAQVIAMRHRLVHDYDEVRLDAVWSVATAEIEPLVAALSVIIPSE